MDTDSKDGTNMQQDQKSSNENSRSVQPSEDRKDVGAGIVRLNLGCGKRKWDGFINVDIASESHGVKPDVVADLRKLPFPDEYADEIHAIHIVEHFYVWEVENILCEWKRTIKPEGKIFIELPCMEKIIGNFVKAMNSPGGMVNLRDTWWGLFGDPGYKNPYMLHHWCYTTGMMSDILKSVGFKKIQIKEPLYHHPNRDMRLEAEK